MARGHLPQPNLPADFANIPTNSPAAGVLSSVPGTEEAADAVMIAQIPTKTTIDPSAAPAVILLIQEIRCM